MESLKKQIADKETEIANTRKLNAINLEVMKHNPNDINDIIPHLKKDAVVINEDGSVTGLAEQLKTLSESKPYLFKTTTPAGTGGSIGGGAKAGSDTGAGASTASKFVDVIKSQQSRRK